MLSSCLNGLVEIILAWDLSLDQRDDTSLLWMSAKGKDWGLLHCGCGRKLVEIMENYLPLHPSSDFDVIASSKYQLNM